MRQGQRLAAFGLPGLERHHRNPALVGKLHRLGEAVRVAETFDVEPDRADPIICRHGFDHVPQPHLRAVAHGQHKRQGQRPALHGQVDGDVRRLTDQRRPALNPAAAVHVRPQRRASAVVDQPVAVRPENRHIARRFEQRLLQRATLALCFRPAGRKARRPASPARGQSLHNIQSRRAVDPDKARIRCCRQISDTAISSPAAYALFAWMHGPDIAFEAHALTLLDDRRSPRTANHSDAGGVEQAVEAVGVGHGHKLALKGLRSPATPAPAARVARARHH